MAVKMATDGQWYLQTGTHVLTVVDGTRIDAVEGTCPVVLNQLAQAWNQEAYPQDQKNRLMDLRPMQMEILETGVRKLTTDGHILCVHTQASCSTIGEDQQIVEEMVAVWNRAVVRGVEIAEEVVREARQLEIVQARDGQKYLRVYGHCILVATLEPGMRDAGVLVDDRDISVLEQLARIWNRAAHCQDRENQLDMGIRTLHHGRLELVHIVDDVTDLWCLQTGDHRIGVTTLGLNALRGGERALLEKMVAQWNDAMAGQTLQLDAAPKAKQKGVTITVIPGQGFVETARQIRDAFQADGDTMQAMKWSLLC